MKTQATRIKGTKEKKIKWFLGINCKCSRMSDKQEWREGREKKKRPVERWMEKWRAARSLWFWLELCSRATNEKHTRRSCVPARRSPPLQTTNYLWIREPHNKSEPSHTCQPPPLPFPRPTLLSVCLRLSLNHSQNTHKLWLNLSESPLTKMKNGQIWT